MSPQQAPAGNPLLNFSHLDDPKGDQVTNRDAPLGNTFSYTLNLTSCLAS